MGGRLRLAAEDGGPLANFILSDSWLLRTNVKMFREPAMCSQTGRVSLDTCFYIMRAVTDAFRYGGYIEIKGDGTLEIHTIGIQRRT